MKLFKYEGYKITISEEAFALKPFKTIWNRDKSPTKDRAISELAFVYFFADSRSDYQFIVDEEERIKRIKEGEGMPEKWVVDKQITEAIEFYHQFKSTAALLLESTRILVDKLTEQMKAIDMNTTDDKGKPIYALNVYTNTIKQIPELVRAIDDAERAVNAEAAQNTKMRGQGEKTIMEDGFEV